METLSNVSLILASDGNVFFVWCIKLRLLHLYTVVYDNELTDAFFSCLVYLHSLISKPPTIIISLEKRYIYTTLYVVLIWYCFCCEILSLLRSDIGRVSVVPVCAYTSMLYNCRLNFSLEDLAVVSPYYKHFRRCLDSTYTTSEGQQLKFLTQQISTDFPQFSDYDRVKELVCALVYKLQGNGMIPVCRNYWN